MKRKQHGVAIVTVLLGLALLATVALGVLALGSQNVLHAHADRQSMTALYAAEAGARYAIAWLNANPNSDWNAPSGEVPAPEPTGTLPDTEATYTVSVTPGGSTAPAPASFTVPGTAADTVYVLATGTATNGQQRSFGALLQKQAGDTFWNDAIFGLSHVDMEVGSYTRSWNSDPMGTVDHTRATIGTNGTITFFGDATQTIVGYDPGKGKFAGSAQAKVIGPPGSTEAGIITSPTGDNYSAFATASTLRDFEDVTVPALAAGQVFDTATGTWVAAPVIVTSNAGGDVLLAPGEYDGLLADGVGSTVTLDASTAAAGAVVEFSFNSIELLNEGALAVNNPNGAIIKVYMESDSSKKGGGIRTGFEMQDGAVLNSGGIPSQLQFHIAGTGYNNVEGRGTAAYYVVYAPQGEVRVNEGAIYGAVVADTVALKGTDFANPGAVFFDNSLLGTAGTGSTNAFWEAASEQRF